MRTNPTKLLLATSLIGLASTVALPAAEPEAAVGVHDAGPWDGVTDLVDRSAATDWFSASGLMVTAITSAVCSGGAVFAGPIPCAMAVGVAAVGGAFTWLSSWLHRSNKDDKRERGIYVKTDTNGYFEWKYPHHPVLEVNRVYNKTSDGLPVRLGKTTCGEDRSPCFSIWYSREELIDKSLHHIHIRPFDFDFRDGTSNDEIGSTRGGYVFGTSSESTLASIIDAGQAQFVKGVAKQMQSSSQFGKEGLHCMDLINSRDSPAGTLGWLYYYKQTPGYPSGAEQGIYDACVKSAERKKLL